MGVKSIFARWRPQHSNSESVSHFFSFLFSFIVNNFFTLKYLQELFLTFFFLHSRSVVVFFFHLLEWMRLCVCAEFAIDSEFLTIDH